MTNQNYNQLYEAVKDFYSDENSQARLIKTTDLWKEAKTETKDVAELNTRVSVMIKYLKSELSCRKKFRWVKIYSFTNLPNDFRATKC